MWCRMGHERLCTVAAVKVACFCLVLLVLTNALTAAPGGEHGVMDDTTLNPHVSAALRDGVGQHFALQPHQWRVTHEWTGIMGFTPDEQPLVGRLHGNCYCAVGFRLVEVRRCVCVCVCVLH